MNTELNPAFTAMAEAMLPELARRKALERPLADALLTKIFGVAAGWETLELAKLSDLKIVETADAFLRALGDSTWTDILVRRATGLGLASLEQMLTHHPYPKTIFLEQ